MHPALSHPFLSTDGLLSASLERLAMAAEVLGGSMKGIAGGSTTERSRRVEWRAPDQLPEAPGPAEVLPSLPGKRLKIVCVPREDHDDLSYRVKTTCREQAEHGLKLSSTFSHDGSVFLVFKRLT